jgi:phospholipase C
MSDHVEPSSAITRRRALRDLGLAGLGAPTLGGLQGLLEHAAAASPRTGSLKDIEHVVIFTQENRETFTWRTMPEILDARGVSWKVYRSASRDPRQRQ